MVGSFAKESCQNERWRPASLKLRSDFPVCFDCENIAKRATPAAALHFDPVAMDGSVEGGSGTDERAVDASLAFVAQDSLLGLAVRRFLYDCKIADLSSVERIGDLEPLGAGEPALL